jgi:hypothetical protein
MPQSDKTKTAAAIAVAVGIPVAVALGIWGAYGQAEVAAGRPDPDVTVSSEAEQMLAAVVDPGTGPRVVEMRAKRSYLKAGASVVLPDLGHALVVKACGSVKQRSKKCPDYYPPEARCACCGGAPGSDCIGGSLCRYGRGQDDACDPDAPGCVPWPCWVYAGDRPEVVAAEAEDAPDAGSDGGAQ